MGEIQGTRGSPSKWPKGPVRETHVRELKREGSEAQTYLMNQTLHTEFPG
jgi:hypothetical protein